MLDQLEMENFQSHQLSKFEFTSGVNVIMGTSNSGKSAVIRLLRWILSNQPRGDGFRRHDIKKTEDTAGTIVKYDGTVISRRRNNSVNEYILAESAEDKDVTFEALRSTVPEEIQTALNLTDINIQSQFNPYFLISDTPGEVSKVLNKHTGLEVIDKVLKAATGNLLKISNKISTLTEQEEEQKKIVDSYKYVDTLTLMKKEMQTRICNVEKQLTTKKDISETLFLIKEYEKERQKLHKVIEAKQKVLLAKKLIQKYKQIDERGSALLSCCSYLDSFSAALKDKNNIIENKLAVQAVLDLYEDRQGALSEIKEVQQAISDLNAWGMLIMKQNVLIKKKPLIVAVLKKYAGYIQITNKKQSLTTLCDTIQHLQQRIKEKKEIIKEENEKLTQIGICPLCGGEWHG